MTLTSLVSHEDTEECYDKIEVPRGWKAGDVLGKWGWHILLIRSLLSVPLLHALET